MAKNNGNLFLNRFNGLVGDKMVLRKGKDMSPYNLAMADWFNRPQFREIDLTGWERRARRCDPRQGLR